jgi:hypothetical protein
MTEEAAGTGLDQASIVTLAVGTSSPSRWLAPIVGDWTTLVVIPICLSGRSGLSRDSRSASPRQSKPTSGWVWPSASGTESLIRMAIPSRWPSERPPASPREAAVTSQQKGTKSA